MVAGSMAALQAYRQMRAMERMGSMMGGLMSEMVLSPFWYLFGTFIGIVIVSGAYALIREEVTDAPGTDKGSLNQSEVDQPEESPRETDTTSINDRRPSMFDILPDDEQRILKAVVESPGITQIALRDRADFSKAKVSRTVSELEKRGLLYRERQGRTYRVYPDDSLYEGDERRP